MIAEPTTTFTDYILAVVSVIFALSLMRSTGGKRTSLTLWGIGFLSSAIAAGIGGTFHGFAPYLQEGTLRALWNVTLVFIGIGAGSMISAAVIGPPKPYRWNRRLLLAGLTLSMVGLVVQQSTLSLHVHFNHNDLYHCIQLAAFACFFAGVKPGKVRPAA